METNPSITYGTLVSNIQLFHDQLSIGIDKLATNTLPLVRATGASVDDFHRRQIEQLLYTFRVSTVTRVSQIFDQLDVAFASRHSAGNVNRSIDVRLPEVRPPEVPAPEVPAPDRPAKRLNVLSRQASSVGQANNQSVYSPLADPSRTTTDEFSIFIRWFAPFLISCIESSIAGHRHRKTAGGFSDDINTSGVIGRMITSSSSSSSQKPITLTTVTPFQAKEIGKGLCLAIITNSTPEGALHTFKNASPFVKSICQVPEMQNLLLSVTTSVMRSSEIGAVLRLFIFASFSIANQISDLIMIRSYWLAEETFYAFGILTMLVLTILLQIGVVFIQHRHRGLWRLTKETMYVCFGIKSGVDAYRAARGYQHHDGAPFNQPTELTFCKGIKMAFHLIPGAIFQIMALLNQQSPFENKFANISIAISIASTAFASSSITFDMDVINVSRSESYFYGMVRSDFYERLMGFFFMFMFSAVQITSRSYICALLLNTDPMYLFYYVGAELSIYLAYKWLRNDLLYWVPIPGIWGYMFSIVARSGVKILTDFTCCAHFRHPYDLGGIYWTMSLFVSNLFNIIVSRYIGSILVTGSLCILWIIFFISFMCSINHSHWSTFFDTRTSGQFTVDNFFERPEDDDAGRIFVFDVRRTYWKPIENEVKSWIQTRWDCWERERPTAFNTRFLNLLLEEFHDLLPPNASRKQGGLFGHQPDLNRRSSIAHVIDLINSAHT